MVEASEGELIGEGRGGLSSIFDMGVVLVLLLLVTRASSGMFIS